MFSILTSCRHNAHLGSTSITGPTTEPRAVVVAVPLENFQGHKDVRVVIVWHGALVCGATYEHMSFFSRMTAAVRIRVSFGYPCKNTVHQFEKPAESLILALGAILDGVSQNAKAPLAPHSLASLQCDPRALSLIRRVLRYVTHIQI